MKCFGYLGTRSRSGIFYFHNSHIVFKKRFIGELELQYLAYVALKLA